MALAKQSADAPSETRPFGDGKGQIEIVDIAGLQAGRGTYEPGWRWSEHVKPIAGTDSCQATHGGYCVSGEMVVRADDGSELTVSAGDFVVIPPGHDAWTVGDEACVLIDWQGYADYAKPQ